MLESANHNQEATGQHGAIDQSGYDCYCPDMSHDYRTDNNYFKSSCDIRLERQECKVGRKCKHFTGPEPVRKVRQQRPKAKCKCCGMKRNIYSRGLCSGCVTHHKRAGTLSNYMKTDRYGNKTP